VETTLTLNPLDVFGIWAVIAFLGLTLAVPLGPINVEIIKQSLELSRGHRIAWFSAILIGIGAMSGDFFMAFMALTLGGEILIDIFSDPLIRLILFIINIAILGYLGFSTLLKGSEITENNNNKDESQVAHSVSSNANIIRHYTNRYITGLSIVVSSPWSYLWWVSAGTIILFSDFNTPDLLSRLIIVIMFLSGIFLWIIIFTTILAVIGQSPNPKFFRWITKGSAVILLFFAILIVGEAWECLVELFSA
jgi:threonine/homoserine/homoserine lactone efflux protein